MIQMNNSFSNHLPYTKEDIKQAGRIIKKLIKEQNMKKYQVQTKASIDNFTADRYEMTTTKKGRMIFTFFRDGFKLKHVQDAILIEEDGKIVYEKGKK